MCYSAHAWRPLNSVVEAVEKVPEARVIGLFWVSFIRKLGVARGQIRRKTDLSYGLVSQQTKEYTWQISVKFQNNMKIIL